MEKKEAVEMAFPFVMPPSDEPYEIYGTTVNAWKIAASTGMTLRDYFAAKAMESLIAGAVRGHIDYGNESDVARRAYEFSDAMLRAREAV